VGSVLLEQGYRLRRQLERGLGPAAGIAAVLEQLHPRQARCGADAAVPGAFRLRERFADDCLRFRELAELEQHLAER